MRVSNRILDIIEDHTLVDDFLLQVSNNLNSGKPMPSNIPQLHDGLTSDVLSNIVQHITKMRGGLM
jgi:hypothetical protein